jgi:flagellar biosynthesis/type III secretory pathway M-ring protein FliF/YscJ
MANETSNLPNPQNQRRYTWPWFVLAAVLLAIALAVAWMSKEIERTRRIRDLNAPAAPAQRGATSSVPVSPPPAGRV